MAKVNVSNKGSWQEKTHEGATAYRLTDEKALRRSIMCCMLWENNFYEDGVDIVKRIQSLIPSVDPEKVAQIAIDARELMKLRHVPLLVVREMAKLKTHKHLVSETLSRIIQRTDELSEFLALYWKDGKTPISKQVKLGLAKAFTKFNEYQLSKYNRDSVVKLRDVLFMVHAKPLNEEQGILWKKLVDNILEIPDTWEVSLSAGKNKKETWERLLSEKKLGALALLKNLRNMADANVDENIIFSALEKMNTERVLPFRFVSAARYAPQWESRIEKAMMKCLNGMNKIPGKTVLLIDVSGSMDSAISSKSEMQRIDAACGLAILARELCENVQIYSFSMALKQIPDRHGFALRDAILKSQEHSGTPLGLAIKSIYAPKTFAERSGNFGYYGAQNVDYKGQELSPDRLIVFTDEQSADAIPDPKGNGYIINISNNKNGVGYGKWTHIDGFSEAVLDFIAESEKELE